MNRVRHTLENNPAFLQKALGSLERYFFLLAFAAYVNQVIPASSEMPFSRWIMTRGEVWNMLDGLRRRGPYLFLFRPVEDLSAFATSHSQLATSQPGGELEHVVIRVGRGVAREMTMCISR